MKIETCIDSLVSYAMNTGLCEPVDHQVATNRLLDLLHMDDYTPSQELLSEDLEEILAGILDYACEKGLCEDNITARDICFLPCCLPFKGWFPCPCGCLRCPRRRR